MIDAKVMQAALATQGNPPNLNTGLIALAIVFLGMLLRHAQQNRKLTLSDNAGLRKEFIDEMRDLRTEVKDLRAENEMLRREVRELHGVIDGLRRGELQATLSAQVMEAKRTPHSPVIDRALGTLNDVVKGGA